MPGTGPGSKQSKMAVAARGIMPFASGSSTDEPSMVYVLPLPVCPYAKMVALNPFMKSATTGNATISYVSACVDCDPRTRSNVNRCVTMCLSPVLTTLPRRKLEFGSGASTTSCCMSGAASTSTSVGPKKCTASVPPLSRSI